MKARTLLTGLFFSASLFAGGGESLDYYKDGIYDTTSLVNKYLKEGLQETVLDQYQGKYLVVLNLEKSSYVETIFFQNIAEKEQIQDVKIAKRINDGKTYMVFGAYDRKADADMIRDRLFESGIDAVVFLNNDPRNGYIVNPIIVKKYLGEIRELIKDMPVKVIKIEKTFAKDGSNCSTTPPPPPLGYSGLSNHMIDAQSIDEEFMTIENEWQTGGELPCNASNYVAFKRLKGTLAGKKNYFIIGEKIKCFTLKNIIRNDYSMTDSIVLIGPDGKERIASRKSTPCGTPTQKSKAKKATPKKVYAKAVRTCANGVVSDFCPEDGGVKPADQKPAQVQTQAQAGVKCDFNRISLAKINGSTVKISASPYAGKVTGVSIVSQDSSYTTVQAAGMPSVSISSTSFKDSCK